MILAHTSYMYVYVHKTYMTLELYIKHILHKYYIMLLKSQNNTFSDLQQTLATIPQEERSGCHNNSAHLFVNYQV